MVKLSKLIKYDNANALEATWVEVDEVEQITTTDEDGNETTTDKEAIVKCHAYDGTQMDMLRADSAELGTPLDEYEALIAEVEANIVPPPPPTSKELAAIAKAERAAAMLSGAPYTLDSIEYRISFTSDDGNGLTQVRTAFDLGVEATNIHFENGTTMPITAAEFSAFAAWFVQKRNEFFV